MNPIVYIKRKLHERYFYKNSVGVSLEEYNLAKNLNLVPLNREEIELIHKEWKGYVKTFNIGYPGFQIYKYYYGFNSKYIPFSYFFPWLLRVLSPVDAARVFVNKCMTYTYFHNIHQPFLIARKVKGCILDKNNKMIDDSQLISLIKSQEKDMIIKLASGSCGGRSIKNLNSEMQAEDIKEIIDSYNGDYVIQNILKQSKLTAKFNSTSLNTFRISTLLLNGEFSILTAMLRFGKKGSIVDNLGSGGACVGINDDGALQDFGYNNQGKQLKEWNGIVFKGEKISCFKEIIETCKKAHYNIPLVAFVGWDIALDENNQPTLIEANIDMPGIFFEQLANARPLFRERHDEVMQYIKDHPLPLLPLYDTTN